jgi:hypothetical protein
MLVAGVVMLHYSAYPNVARTGHLRSMHWQVLDHPQQSSAFSPSHFCVFNRFRRALKGCWFWSVEYVKVAVVQWFQQ